MSAESRPVRASSRLAGRALDNKDVYSNSALSESQSTTITYQHGFILSLEAS
jgi:hypothetical protein